MTRTRFSVVAAFIFALFLISAASAQITTWKIVNGGVLNGKATSLPKPKYPEAARATGISGMIAVDIVIDESGTVIKATSDPNDVRPRVTICCAQLDPIRADRSLREAAEKAAMQARFSPRRLNGQPIRVRGRLTYNFVFTPVKTERNPYRINEGPLDGSVGSQPAPAYPEAAKAVKAQGFVSVQITIDENGNVISAQAVSGHPLLRTAAEEAAREAKFAPTIFSGLPVKLSGLITYNFVLPKKTVNGHR